MKQSILFHLESVLLLFAACADLQSASAASEVWVSAQTNALGTRTIAGTGTVSDPYSGDFDAVMLSLPANTTIHLGPGTFYTKGYTSVAGDLLLKANQKVIGAGIDQTIVRRDNSFHKDVQIEGQLTGRADGVEVSDLTVDAAASGNENYKKQGVSLLANNCVARRVKVVNVVGNFKNGFETFGIYVGDTGSVGGLISNCEVSSVQGNYCTAIAVSGTALVEFNNVIFPVPTSAGSWHFQAYQASASQNAIFRSNACYGGSYGFYSDTFSETNLVIEHNFFRNVWNGINFSKTTPPWHVEGLSILGNLIEISGAIAPGCPPYIHGIAVFDKDLTGTNRYSNILIHGNTVRFYRGGGKSSQKATFAIGTGPSAANFDNIRVVGNTFEPGFVQDIRTRDLYFADNTDLAGLPLQARQIAGAAAGVMLLDSTNSHVLVAANTTSALRLPPSTGNAGKRIVIINQKTKGNLRVVAQPGETLLPASPVQINPNDPATFLSDGSGTWTKQ